MLLLARCIVVWKEFLEDVLLLPVTERASPWEEAALLFLENRPMSACCGFPLSGSLDVVGYRALGCGVEQFRV